MNDSLLCRLIPQIIPVILLIGLLWLGFLVLKNFWLTLTWSFIIAYITWPVYIKVRRYLNNEATLSALVMTAIIASVTFLAFYGIADMLKHELQTAYQSLALTAAEHHIQLPDNLRRVPWLGDYLQAWLDRLTHDQAGIIDQLAAWAKQWLAEFAKLLGGIGRYFINLGLILVTVFFCFRDGEAGISQIYKGLKQALGDYLPLYLHAAGNTTRAVVYGLVLAALGQGVVAGLGYAVAGVQAPVLFGLLTALLALIPMGATLIWLPLGIHLILSGQLWPGVGLLLWGLFAISTIDNIIRPLVISGATRLPILIVMFGVLGGLSAFGAIGLFLGPVILSVLLTVWQAWLKQQT